MEIDAENLIIDWLKNNGFSVYTNRTSINLHTTLKFTTKGLSNKPDLIFYSNSHGWIAVEIKPAYSRRSLGDGKKIINYWEDYTQGRTKYYIDFKEIQIDYFVIATGYSINGHLKADEIEVDYQDYPRHPAMEFTHSKEYVRSIWDSFREKKRRAEIPPDSAGWGALLSTALNRDSRNKPALYTQRYLYNNYKKKPETFLDFKEVM